MDLRSAGLLRHDGEGRADLPARVPMLGLELLLGDLLTKGSILPRPPAIQRATASAAVPPQGLQQHVLGRYGLELIIVRSERGELPLDGEHAADKRGRFVTYDPQEF